MKQAWLSVGAAVLVLMPLPALSAQPTGISVVAPALAEMRQRASAGTAQAQYDLAIALLCGTRMQRHPAEAAKWMRKAAEQDHRGAQSVLGWMFMTGTGVQRDDGKAVPWLLGAAQGGEAAAANNLSILYALGQGVEKDNGQAERWFSAAIAEGAADAARNLETLHSDKDRAGAPKAAITRALHPALTGVKCNAS